jgi:hypothetical protein
VAAPCVSSSASPHGNSFLRRCSPTSSMTRRSGTPRSARRCGVALARACAGGLTALRVDAHDAAVPHAVPVTIAALGAPAPDGTLAHPWSVRLKGHS